MAFAEMSKILIVAMFSFMVSSSFAEKFGIGSDLDKMKKSMAKAHYKGGDGELIFGGVDSRSYTVFWKVDKGYLKATFDPKNRKITALVYSAGLASQTIEDTIKHYTPWFVEWFDTKTGQMLLNLNKANNSCHPTSYKAQ